MRIGDGQPHRRIEHAQALRHVVHGGVEPIARGLELARAPDELRLGGDEPAQLPGPGAQQETRATDHQQHPGADREHAPVPARQDGGFQQGDVDGQRVALQRPDRDEADALHEISAGAEMAASVAHGFIERRAGGQPDARLPDRFRIAPEQRAVLAHQHEGLAAHRAHGFVDVGEVSDLHTDRHDAGELAVARVDALVEVERRRPGEAARHR